MVQPTIESESGLVPGLPEGRRQDCHWGSLANDELEYLTRFIRK